MASNYFIFCFFMFTLFCSVSHYLNTWNRLFICLSWQFWQCIYWPDSITQILLTGHPLTYKNYSQLKVFRYYFKFIPPVLHVYGMNRETIKENWSVHNPVHMETSRLMLGCFKVVLVTHLQKINGNSHWNLLEHNTGSFNLLRGWLTHDFFLAKLAVK